MYSGIGVKGLPNSPSSMFLAKVNCNGCHKEPEQLKADGTFFETAAATAKECVTCHGEGYDQMMETWQEVTTETLASVKEAAEEVRLLVERDLVGDDAKSKEAREHYERAVKVIRFIETDGSLGVHNLDYADAALTLAEEELDSARKLSLQRDAAEGA
jgi:hypothetical protein